MNDLARQAAALRAEADRIEAKAAAGMEAARRDASALREAAGHLERATGSDAARRRLQSYDGRSTIRGVTEGQMRGMQAGIRVRKGELHPLQAWLYERTSEPRTLKALAEWLGGNMTPERVTSWCKRGAGRRQAPASIAARLAEIGFPATPANWPNGLRAKD